MNWTDEQVKAIKARNESILVSAAAGSGKTSVMVERISDIILSEDTDIDRLIVMTFTHAAAGNMKKKIASRLSELSESGLSDRRALRQLKLLDRARISTIHAFCQHLIRENTEYLDIDPGFRIADEGESMMMRRDTLALLIEERLGDLDETGAVWGEVMDFLRVAVSDARLSDLINMIYGFTSARPWQEEFIKEGIEEFQRELGGDVSGSRWFKAFIERVHAEAAAKKELLMRAALLCGEPDGPAKYLDEVLKCIPAAESIMAADSYEALRESVFNLSFESLPPIRGKDGADPAKKDMAASIRNGFKDFVKSLKNESLLLSPDDFREVSRGIAGISISILRTVLDFKKEFDNVKREKNILEFDDLEHLSLKLLYDEGKTPSLLSEEILSPIREIMIDEYQDTSLVQEEILRALSGSGKRPVFMVGDIKQSIYRFRNADPAIFAGKYGSFSLDPSASERKILLNTNFRSRKEVINSVNDVFSLCMTKEVGGVDYDESVWLVPGAEYTEGPGYETEVLIYDPSLKGDTDVGDTLGADEMECRMIAERIKSLMRDKLLIRGEDKRLRPVEYGDIAVLSRSKKSARLLLKVLGAHEIPSHFDTDEGYFETEEVSLIMDLLRIIDNPLQDIPLAAVLLSPIGDFSSEELALIKASYQEYSPERNAGDLYRALRYAADQGISDRAASWLKTFLSYREKADILPVHMLLNEIYTESGYYAYVSALSSGKARTKNLDMLIEKAVSYARTSYQGLFNFVRYVETLQKYERDFGEAYDDKERSSEVSIMTIHGAKGLEFPVVILSRAGAQFNLASGVSGVRMSDFGIAADYIDPDTNIRYRGLKNQLIAKTERDEGIAEEQRLLYVAMTRAKEKLIITGSLRKKKNAEDPMKKYLDRVRMIGSDYIPAEYIRGMTSYLDRVLLAKAVHDEDFSLRVLSDSDILNMEEESLEDSAGLYEKIRDEAGRAETAELLKSFKSTYSFSEETKLRPKVSVSDIKHMAIEALESGHRAAGPEEYVYTLGAGNGALRGTAFHRAMELIDFGTGPDEEYRALMAHPHFAAGEKKLLDREAVREFLYSPIAERMRKAAAGGKLYREQRFMAGFPANSLIEGEKSGELVILQGIIDTYFEEDGELVIVDYKTDRGVDRETLRARYETQLKLYQRALSALSGKTVAKLVIYSTFLKTEIEV